MTSAGGHQNREPGLDFVLNTVKYRLAFAFLYSEELIELVDLRTDIFTRLKAHHDELAILRRIQDLAERLVLLRCLFNVGDVALHSFLVGARNFELSPCLCVSLSEGREWFFDPHQRLTRTPVNREEVEPGCARSRPQHQKQTSASREAANLFHQLRSDRCLRATLPELRLAEHVEASMNLLPRRSLHQPFLELRNEAYAQRQELPTRHFGEFGREVSLAAWD
jgi:hypothetical protein